MRIRIAPALGALLGALCLPLLAQQNSFYLKDGDRVVFYGDSITDQRLYTTFVETYVITRFPQLKVSFVHSGVGGDRVDGGSAGPIDVRLWRDVMAYKPTVMTCMLGMNDAKYRAFETGFFEAYVAGYRHLVQRVKESLPGIRLTLIQPSPYDDVTRPPMFEGGYNAVLLRYADFVKQLAHQQDATLADLNAPVVAVLEKALKLDAEGAKKIVPDRVHPAPGGHLIMAEALLKAWNAPAIVSDVEIDAAAGTVVRAVRSEVSDLKTGDHITWMQIDQALPMPLDAKDDVLTLALRASDFVEALDQQPLKVTGLTAAKYALKIDDQPIRTFTKEELAAGINLGSMDTPMSRQAAGVHDITLRHNSVHFARWRMVDVNLQNIAVSPAHLHAADDALDAVEADAVEQQHAAAQPKPHRFELTAEQ